MEHLLSKTKKLFKDIFKDKKILTNTIMLVIIFVYMIWITIDIFSYIGNLPERIVPYTLKDTVLVSITLWIIFWMGLIANRNLRLFKQWLKNRKEKK